ncbi:putative RNA-directed DNA polymerase [Helianthus annuus]|nr:putative RNA-directed DNA polymerase [Helianthus annuus]
MASKNLQQMSCDIAKLERFDGKGFKRWQKKMQLLLATLNVSYVLTKQFPEGSENETMLATCDRLEFENDDIICRGHILNAMSGPLFDVYRNIVTARELWNTLEERYYIEDATIEKFPSTWKVVEKNLKRRKDEMTLKDLRKHPRIKEEYRSENKTKRDTSKVHMMGRKGKSSNNGRKRKRFDNKGKGKFKENKKNVICDNCNQPGRYKQDCRLLKGKTEKRNDKEKDEKGSNFVAMISDAFSLEEDKSWWVDSGATLHVCNNISMFKTYESTNFTIYMGNHATAQVKGKGNIDLVFISGHTLTLKDVLHVPEVRKNLVSASALTKHGFKLMFEGDKFILSKGKKFVGLGFHTDGMFKLSIKDVVNSSVNDVLMTESSNATDVPMNDVNKMSTK